MIQWCFTNSLFFSRTPAGSKKVVVKFLTINVIDATKLFQCINLCKRCPDWTRCPAQNQVLVENGLVDCQNNRQYQTNSDLRRRSDTDRIFSLKFAFRHCHAHSQPSEELGPCPREIGNRISWTDDAFIPESRRSAECVYRAQNHKVFYKRISAGSIRSL